MVPPTLSVLSACAGRAIGLRSALRQVKADTSEILSGILRK